MYKEISDYGIIGDTHTVALVSNQGSIDYCSMPCIDSGTVFASILDDEKGGFFSIQPQTEFESQQAYLKDTNILQCRFKTKTGEAQLTDFMPLATDELFEKKNPVIHRSLKVTEGSIDFKLECFLRPEFSSWETTITKEDNTFIIKAKDKTFILALEAKGYQVAQSSKDRIVINFSLNQAEGADFDFIYGQDRAIVKAKRAFEQTQEFWLDWVHNCIAGKCQFLGEHTDMIHRSLLVLKLLSFSPSGAIVAAATTSLPEALGGRRNWDYRFSWIRDAAFTLKALFSLGHIREADGFVHWLHNLYLQHSGHNLQIMYSVGGQNVPAEKSLEHLKGYKDSKPVRIGNSASKQNQWDIYGEIMDTALRLSDYVGKIDDSLWPFFKDICNLADSNWSKPDYGIWEVRSGPLHFVYSKVMCWVALDRGIKIAKRYGFSAPLAEWEKGKAAIKNDVLEKGYDLELESFVRSYGSKELDSSLLLLPLVGFLPIDDPRIKQTIENCQKYLMKEGYLLRYQASDGLEGQEGGFILCNFWLTECLVASGKTEEAKKILNQTLKSANHLGLFAEEYDHKNKQMLGNFPQAFSHIGFINSVSAILNLQNKLRKDGGQRQMLERMKKLMPYKVILNQADKPESLPDQGIASQLKTSLNNLQGAFFNYSEGKVNYKAMRISTAYGQYLELAKKLSTFNLSGLKTDAEKKAFWINIYNVIIIHGVIEFAIDNSIKEVFKFFSRIGYRIGGLYFSPDDIEHGILRTNQPYSGLKVKQFKPLDKRGKLVLHEFDPRIHFALVCAASSCPPIEFYHSENIDKQLDSAGRSFLNRNGLILDEAKNILYLSQIFKWYADDFGQDRIERLKYILKYADSSISAYVQANLEKIKIKYLPYNWNLNKTLGGN